MSTNLRPHHNGSLAVKPTTFPLDVLLVVFRYLLPMVRKKRWRPITSSVWKEDELERWSPYGRSKPDLTFTESLASVCPVWREAMSLIPSFWTRLVIWVGRQATPLAQVRQYLAWSRDLPLDIYVLQRPNESDSDESDNELKARVKARVDAVFGLLGAHMKRWRVLRMEVVHSSNIPRPRIDLVGQANILETLELIFDVDNSVADTSAGPPTFAQLDTPKLEGLIIGGSHFRELFVASHHRSPMPPLLRDAGIFNYGSQHPPFHIYDLLSCLARGNLRVLKDVALDNLQLDCSRLPRAGPVVPHASGYGWYANVHFTDVPNNVIAEYNSLLGYPYADRIEYTRCLPMARCMPLADCHEIVLNDIDDPQTIVNLLVPRCDTDENSTQIAYFYDCDGLLREVFFVLSLPFLASDTDEWLCPCLDSLTIVSCTNFTSSELRRFVEARSRAHAASGSIENGEGGFVVSPIFELTVRNCCELAEEDEQWFEENVTKFSWR